jgi:hypothetical protein
LSIRGEKAVILLVEARVASQYRAGAGFVVAMRRVIGERNHRLVEGIARSMEPDPPNLPKISVGG